MLNFFGKLVQFASHAATKIRVRSALNPMLWLCLIGPLIFLTAASWFKDDLYIKWILIIVGSLPVVFTCVGFCFFALFKPEKLQSEEFQIQQQALGLLAQDTSNKDLIKELGNVGPNPQMLALEENDGGKI